MNIAIIKYNAGNVQSVRYALLRLGISALLTDDPKEIASADKVIFPGVGNAASAMQYLMERNLDMVIKSLTQPVLGICLGLQLLCSHTEEGDTSCLNIFNTDVKLFKPSPGSSTKVPQVGWNTITGCKSQLFNNLPSSAYVYYVHSYYAELSQETIATTDYILPYSAALQKDNFYATQFHPEKSGTLGGQILQNFLSL